MEGDVYDILQSLLEESSLQSEENNFEKTFITKLVGRFPELHKEFIINAPTSFEKQWIVFVAPRDFGTIQRNLIIDYSSLIKRFEESNKAIGGFKLFENHSVKRKDSIPVTAIVPLNNNQLKVVNKVISGNEITIVSGPPGCGKSQVVISILLNAWSNGQSVLFASSNNQAVDVVRERMKEYERTIPMVVRCGAKKTSELMSTLSNIITVIDNHDSESIHTVSDEDITRLESELENVTELLDSKLPQRIDELSRAALGAYGKAGEYKDSWEAELSLYDEKIRALKIDVKIENFDDKVYEPFENWLHEHNSLIELIERNQFDKKILYQKIEDLKNHVSLILSPDYKNYDGSRKIDSARLGEIKEWYSKYKGFLLQFIEDDLKPIEWQSEFDNWTSEKDAKIWAEDAEAYLDSYKAFAARFSEDIADVNRRRKRADTAKEALRSQSIKELNGETFNELRQWTQKYHEYIMLPNSFGNSLPFSSKSKLDKELNSYEIKLSGLFGAEYLTHYVTDKLQRREYIARHADALFEEYNAMAELQSCISKLSNLQVEQKVLNDKLRQIGFTGIESVLDENECRQKNIKIEEKLHIAKEARRAFDQKARRFAVIKKDRDLKFSGSQLLYSLIDGINKESELNKFFIMINSYMYDELSLVLLKEAREIAYKHDLEAFFERLGNACVAWDEIDIAQADIKAIKDNSVYQKEWVDSCPISLHGIFSKMSYQSAIAFVMDYQPKITGIHNEWTKEGQCIISELKEKEQQEYDWAWNSIEKALELCPEKWLPYEKDSIINYIRNNVNVK